MPDHIYLSPHLDDAVLSCGGLIAKQTEGGEAVTVLTVCAGDPPEAPLSSFAQELHARWGRPGPPVAARREEDHRACGYLGANILHLDIPDAVYRRGEQGEALYASEQVIFGPLHAAEAELVDRLRQMLFNATAASARLYCPLGFGGHVDHRLTRLAAEGLGRKLWYYQDLPYAARDNDLPSDLSFPHGEETTLRLSEVQLESWVEAASLYRSQLSTFWSNTAELREELCAFYHGLAGLRFIAPKGEA
jgi:LmbE family N-acetylglucosaminyl deacetylase